MKERIGCIYLLRNLVNGKGYVGQTVCKPSKRWNEHICISKLAEQPLYRAIRKYGVENFSAEVVYVCAESRLNAAEKRWVKRLNTFIDTGCGYNLTTGGGSKTKFSEETCAKMSESIKLSIAKPEVHARYVEAANDRWARYTPEQRILHRQAVKAGMLLKPWVPTQEQSNRMSAAGKRRWDDPEHRKLMLEKLRKAAKEPALCAIRSVNAAALWLDPAFRAKMKAAQLERRALERKQNAQAAQTQAAQRA